MRLLQLPDVVLDMLREGKLSAGHARALITSDSPAELAERVVRNGLSVRETEKLVKKVQAEVQNIFEGGRKASGKQNVSKDADTAALEGDLSAALGMKVSVDHKPGQEGGQLVIRYDTLEQLDELCRSSVLVIRSGPDEYQHQR